MSRWNRGAVGYAGLLNPITHRLKASAKKNMKKKSSKKSVSALRRVTLKFQIPTAVSVRVSGSFNQWDPLGVALTALADSTWSLDLDLAPGRYEYRLLVDGEWADVPGASESVQNPFGGRNAVLVVNAPGLSLSGIEWRGPAAFRSSLIVSQKY